MPKVIIAGNKGRMGQAAEWACNKLGYDVLGIDLGDRQAFTLHDKDIFISCMPYHQNLSWAKKCIDAGVSYIDLGGRVDVDHAINDYAEKNLKAGCVHTSAGLAPGLVNVMAEKCVREIENPYSVQMFCGGLPADSSVNPIGYLCNWSVDGLINEYMDDCEVLEDGKVKIIPGMTPFNNDDNGRFTDRNGNTYEAFSTSGGACHSLRSFQKRGILNCGYNTLRYPGHRDVMHWLLMNLEQEEIAKLVCRRYFEDKVVVYTYAYSLNGGGTFIENNKVVYCSKQFSAMQRATAFSLVSAAKVMLSPREPKIMTYEDFNNTEFFLTFELLLNEDR